MTIGADDMTCRAAAYHEAAHIVIASAVGLPISPKGISIDGFANGLAHFKGATSGTKVAAEEVDKVVISMLAGGIVHGGVHGNVEHAIIRDERRIKEIMDEHIANPEARKTKREELETRASELASKHWQAIEAVAEALWSKSWKPRNRHIQLFRGKTLDGTELKALLTDITLVVDETVE